jgi:ABC-type antimicrobial peptide transport system permease subunit
MAFHERRLAFALYARPRFGQTNPFKREPMHGLAVFIRSALVLTGIGVAIGLAAAAGLMRLMKSLLFGVSPLDPFTYVSVLIVLAASAVLASYLPARRAAAVNPVEALRAE